MSNLESVFMSVAAMSWQGGWLILLLVGLRLALRRQVAPAMMFAGWIMVAGMLLMPLRLPVPWDPLGLGGTARMRTPTVASSTLVLVEDLPVMAAAPMLPLVGPEPEEKDATAGLKDEGVRFEVFDVQVSTTRRFIGELALIWLAGAAGLLMLRAITVFRLRRRLQDTALPGDEILVGMVRDACAALGINRVPAIVVTPLVGTPALCGIIRPQLLFPAGFFTRLTVDELRWVVWHELGHLQRRDLFTQTLLQLACAVHWFNPLVWLAARLARHDCELACDAFVLRRAKAEDGEDYGRALLKVIGRTVGKSALPSAVGIVESKRQLLKRLTLIADYRRGRIRPLVIGTAILAGAVFVGYTAPGNLSDQPEEETKRATEPVGPQPLPSQGNRAARAERLAAMEAQADALQIEVRAVGEVGGVPVAFIDLDGEPSVVMTGSRFFVYRITSIDVARGEVALTQRDQDRVLAVTNPRPLVFPVMSEQRVQSLLASPEYLRSSNAWERGLPDAVVVAWKKINREAREQILLNYLQSGYVMSYFLTEGRIHGSPRHLLAARMQQGSLTRRDAFIESLTPAQREAYAGGVQRAIRFTAPPEERAAQAAEAEALQARQAEVIAKLTPAQRALYEQWQSRQQRSPAGPDLPPLSP